MTMGSNTFVVMLQIDTDRLFVVCVVVSSMFQFPILNNGVDPIRSMGVFRSFDSTFCLYKHLDIA